MTSKVFKSITRSPPILTSKSLRPDLAAHAKKEIFDKLSSGLKLVSQNKPLSEKQIEEVANLCGECLDKAKKLPFRSQVCKEVSAIASRHKGVQQRLQFEKMVKETPDTEAGLIKIVESSRHLAPLLEDARTDQAEKGHPEVQLSFVNPEKATAGAQTHSLTGCIEIDREMPLKEKLFPFVFELTNVINNCQLLHIRRAVQLGLLSKDEFCRAIARIEHEGGLYAHEKLKAAIRDEGWDPAILGDYSQLELQLASFEDDYEIRKQIGHIALYEMQYDNLKHDNFEIDSQESIFQILAMCTTLLNRELINSAQQLRKIDALMQECLKRAKPLEEMLVDYVAEITSALDQLKPQLFKRTLQNTPDTEEGLLEFFRNSEHFAELLRKAQFSQKVKLSFVDNADTPRSCCFENGQIEINRALPLKDKIISFAVQLTHIINNSNYKDLNRAVSLGILTKEEYCSLMAKLEFEGCSKISRMTKECIRDEGWDSDMDVFGFESFDEFLLQQKEDGTTKCDEERYDELHNHSSPLSLQSEDEIVEILFMCRTLQIKTLNQLNLGQCRKMEILLRMCRRKAQNQPKKDLLLYEIDSIENTIQLIKLIRKRENSSSV